jgi:hypothetical protein
MKYIIALYTQTGKCYYRHLGDGADYLIFNHTQDPNKALLLDTKQEAWDKISYLAQEFANFNIPVALAIEEFDPNQEEAVKKRYTFLAVYTELPNSDDTMRLAQSLVLEEWRAHLEHHKISFIPSAKVSFKTYNFSKYPYQELLRNWIWKRFTNSFGDLCFSGTVYTDVDELIADLDVEKKLIELTVEVD